MTFPPVGFIALVRHILFPASIYYFFENFCIFYIIFQGNGVNQAVVFDNKICDYVNHILRVGVYKECSPHEVRTSPYIKVKLSSNVKTVPLYEVRPALHTEVKLST